MKLSRAYIAIPALFMLMDTSTTALDVKMHGVNYNMRKGADWEPDELRCKSPDQLQRDMFAIKQVTDRVRIFSLVDCNQGEYVLRAAKTAGLQVHLGIWTTTSMNYLLRERDALGRVIDMGLYDSNIIGLQVGSEAIYRREITPETAINYLNVIRDYLRGRGINTPCTIADVIDIYIEYPEIPAQVDYYNINIFSYWEGVDVNEGAARTLDRIRAARKMAEDTGKQLTVAEVGWSSGGYNITTGESTPEAQAKFFADWYKVATSINLAYYWFSASDSLWRVTNGGYSVEAYFGIFQEDDTMKSNFQALTIGAPRYYQAIRSDVTNLLLTESNAAVSITGTTNSPLAKEHQRWFFDPTTQQIRSQSGDRCLDGYQPWDGGIVHCYRCMDNEMNQKWMYESTTGKLKHGTYTAFCLDVDPAQNNKVQLQGCSPNNPNQRFTILDGASI
ncbi:hypothetical protein CCR75_009583 [Bremia lactucae]|uniref:glucan endo-1,3-beta-D-glucosidase n=1 Tax=Bremia lactucae TaxID=4779 RepID=A0A976FE97_BRELC|nr:hypothetical protein CCR75_009583 [Bremia lactucae]